MTCCPHTMWGRQQRSLTVENSWQTFYASRTVSGVGAERPLQRSVSLCRRRRQHVWWHADVSSRSARDHATEAVVAVCWSSRQRGRAARSVQTPHGSARRHVRRSSQNPKIRVRFRELSERGIIQNPKIPNLVPVSKGAKRPPPRTAKLL